MNTKEISVLNISDLSQQLNDLFTLTDTVIDTINSILIPQLNSISLDLLTQSFTLFVSSCETLLKNIDVNNLTNVYVQLMLQLEQQLSSYDFSSLNDDVDICDDYVTLSDDAIESFNNIFYECNNEQVPNISSKMETKEFLFSILIPLVCMLIPMLQNSYYRKLDSIESQKLQAQETAYQEELLEIELQQLENEIAQTEYLQQILQLIEEEYSKTPEDTQKPSE